MAFQNCVSTSITVRVRVQKHRTLGAQIDVLLGGSHRSESFERQPSHTQTSV